MSDNWDNLNFKVGDKVIRTWGSHCDVDEGDICTVSGFGDLGAISLVGRKGAYDPQYFKLVTDETTVEDTDEVTKYVVSDRQFCETRILTLEQIHDEVLEGTIDLSDTTIYKLGEEVKINLKTEVVSNGEEG